VRRFKSLGAVNAQWRGAAATVQVAKVHLGQLKCLVTFFTDQLVVHINCLPLVVAMVAGVDCNAGLLMALENDLSKALASLRDSVKNIAE
jgi:hypothetical protein